LFRASGFGFRISHLGDRLPVVLFRCAPPSANQEIELWPSTLNTLNYFRARGSTVQSLSGREREILVLLDQGKDAASIATKLGLSGGTVGPQSHAKDAKGAKTWEPRNTLNTRKAATCAPLCRTPQKRHRFHLRPSA
jgi:hypothetical protein